MRRERLLTDLLCSHGLLLGIHKSLFDTEAWKLNTWKTLT